MGSNLPKARGILSSALSSRDPLVLRAAIAEALTMMTRVYVKQKAPTKSRKMTPALARRIRSFYTRHPHMSVNEIGAHYGVNGGRVSEAIHGHWDDPKWVADYVSRTQRGARYEIQ